MTAAPAPRTGAVRRLPMPTSHHQPPAEEKQQLSDISAAPRTDGRRLPSGRRAGGAGSALSCGGEDALSVEGEEHSSFELVDEKNLRGSMRGDAVPFIATICSPVSSSISAGTAAGAARESAPGDGLTNEVTDQAPAAVREQGLARGNDDVEVPAPRAPPRPMEQGGSARASPAKGAGADGRKDKTPSTVARH